MDIRLSELDEAQFGIKSARANNVTIETLPDVMNFCQTNGVKFLIARTPVTQLPAVQAMERAGFLLMDTLVYYACDLNSLPAETATSELTIRPLQTGEAGDVRTIAAAAFRDYFGHYHADDRLDRQKCDEVYQLWAANSVTSRELADEVLVAIENDTVVGFVTLLLNTPDEGEIRLIAVAPQAQRRGIAQLLMRGAMRWFRGQGASTMIISTQVNNYAVQKAWVRVGMELSHGYYTLHKWFD